MTITTINTIGIALSLFLFALAFILYDVFVLNKPRPRTNPDDIEITDAMKDFFDANTEYTHTRDITESSAPTYSYRCKRNHWSVTSTSPELAQVEAMRMFMESYEDGAYGELPVCQSRIKTEVIEA